jgi:hypothetical protein
MCGVQMAMEMVLKEADEDPIQELPWEPGQDPQEAPDPACNPEHPHRHPESWTWASRRRARSIAQVSAASPFPPSFHCRQASRPRGSRL